MAVKKNEAAETIEQRLARLEAENDTLKTAAANGIAPALAADVKRRMEAGLTREQAISCAQAQAEHDAALEKAAKK